ncbi:sensor histidine kinase [Actinoallomurus acanthiterrae]
MVEAAAAERRRIERNLHDGAQQRLVALAFVIGRIRARLATGDAGPGTAADLDEAAEELRAAIGEVRELARGIHPSILSEAGLGPALTSLAERSAAPVTVLSAPEDRLPEGVEEAAYFVAAEAVANALKHARASRITIAVAERDGRLTVEVADDGAGGADPGGGTGLLGLSDRVAALGRPADGREPPGSGHANRRRAARPRPGTRAGAGSRVAAGGRGACRRGRPPAGGPAGSGRRSGCRLGRPSAAEPRRREDRR